MKMFRINNKERMTKMMRYARILILLVVSMAAVAGATSCKKESKDEKGKKERLESKLIGTWSCDEEERVTITIKKGGKGTFKSERSVSIKWKLKGEDLTVNAGGDIFEGTFDGETVELSDLGTFSKE